MMFVIMCLIDVYGSNWRKIDTAYLNRLLMLVIFTFVGIQQIVFRMLFYLFSYFYTLAQYFILLKINPYCDQTWLKKHCTSNFVSLFCIPDDTLRELTWLVAINWGHLYYKIEYLAVNAYLYNHCSTQSYNTNKNTNSNR